MSSLKEIFLIKEDLNQEIKRAFRRGDIFACEEFKGLFLGLLLTIQKEEPDLFQKYLEEIKK